MNALETPHGSRHNLQRFGILVIYDASDPASPTFMGAVDTPGQGRAVEARGDTVFVADGTSGLGIYDVSDRTDPSEIARFPLAGDAVDNAAADGFVYVAAGEGGLYLFPRPE